MVTEDTRKTAFLFQRLSGCSLLFNECGLFPQHLHCHRINTHCRRFFLQFLAPIGFVLVDQNNNKKKKTKKKKNDNNNDCLQISDLDCRLTLFHMMENDAIGLVDARMATANDESLVAESYTAEEPDTSTVASWAELLSNNNNYYYNNDDDNDDVLTDVLTQVRHAYVLPPATSAHGNLRYDTTFVTVATL